LEQRTQDLTLTFTPLSLYEKYLIYNTRARSSIAGPENQQPHTQAHSAEQTAKLGADRVCSFLIKE
jgi:hypothetical protein